MAKTENISAEQIKESFKTVKEQEELFSEIESKIKSVSDYTKLYNEYLTKSKETAGALHDIYQDKAKMLTKQVFSSKNLEAIQKSILSLESKSENLIKTRLNLENQNKNLVEKTKKLWEESNKDLTKYSSLKKEIDEQIEQNKQDIKNSSIAEQEINEELKNRIQFLNDANVRTTKREALERLSLTVNQALNDILPQHLATLVKINDVAKENPYMALYIAAKALYDLLIAQNKEVVQIRKTLNISGEEARNIRDRFVEIERSTTGTEAIFVTTKNQLEAMNQLVSEFGAGIDYSGKRANEVLKSQISLTKEFGLATEDASKLSGTMLMLSMTQDQITGTFAKSTVELKSQRGITVSLNQVMKEVANMSAATALSLFRNPKALSDAVVKAKELGVAIEKMNAMADSLLNIESSLNAQFEASVLTGRNLNFELAREKALRNDIAGAADEVLKQVGSAADFTNMNRIQQEAIAKSVGMTRDELANSLMTQEKLSKLSTKARADLEDRLKGLSEEQRMQVLRNINNEQDAVSAAKKITAQDKLNQTLEKMQSILGNIFSALEPIIDGFATIFETIVKYKVILYPLIGILSVIAAKTLMTAVASIWKAFTLIGPWGIAGAVAATAGMIAMSTAAAKSADDAIINPEGGLVVSGPKGSINLDKNDSIIAGTNLNYNATSKTETGGISAGDRLISTKLDSLINSLNFSNMKFVLALDGRQFETKVVEIVNNSQKKR